MSKANDPHPAPSGSALRDEARANLAALKQRHPTFFTVTPRQWLARIGVPLAIIAFTLYAMVQLDFSLTRIINGSSHLGRLVVLMFPPSPAGLFWYFLDALGQTLAIAFLGTLIAALLAFPVAFLAAKNVVPNIFVHFAARRGFDIMRSVDTLIWALMWVSVVGLGPFAGVLAIACSDFGSFGKLFSEAIEATDRKGAEGVAASGGGHVHQVRFGLLPQVLPVMASQVLYYFESNTRSATIIGIVGAGGVGVYLSELIRVLEMPQVAFLIIMILITVAIIDWISTRLRFAIIGRTAATQV
jgi:phosphonate transport system permease protein